MTSRTNEQLVLAFDLGTGSCKASLWAADGRSAGSTVVEYATYADSDGFREQSPHDWWRALVGSTRTLIESGPRIPPRIAGIAISGHSLGVVGVDRAGDLLRARTPIWSDGRGVPAAEEFFASFDEAAWYATTGCGFPPGLYPFAKLGWYRRNDPRFLDDAAHILGTKDWLNYRLTGVVATDPSYASGSGFYDLMTGDYSAEILDAAQLDRSLFAPIRPSASIVGELLPEVATELGLMPRIPVSVGGVDNSCMALGSLNTSSGRGFISLGSSSWAVVTSEQPRLDFETRPYTFASLIPGLFDSALSSFGAGSSLRWVRETLLSGIGDEQLVEMARTSEPGARGLTFLPMLTGGAAMEGGSEIRGSLVGLDSSHVPADLARAAIEGTVFAMSRAYKGVSRLAGSGTETVATGGGARNDWILQLYADVLDVTIVTTDVDQQAATLGAAATAFVALGEWAGLPEVSRAHHSTMRYRPDPDRSERYAEPRQRFERILDAHISTTRQLQER